MIDSFRRTGLFILAVFFTAVVCTSCSVFRDSSGGSNATGNAVEGSAEAGNAEAGNADAGGSASLGVVVTFDALYELAVAIGGERARVSNIMPPGADAHHFEPGARDLGLLSTADVLLICGLGFEPWVQNAVTAAANDKLVMCDVSLGIEPIGVEEHEGSHEHGYYDPHIWLSPACAVIIAENIRDTFIQVDPDGAEYYSRNYDEFSGALNRLLEEYSGKFKDLVNRTIVTGHAVFAYLCRDFGLVQNSIEGVFEEGEPSARALADLIDFCRSESITAILTESLSSPLVAETLAAEAGADVIVIYTMESAEEGLTYIARMEHNLSVIYDVLCNCESQS